MSRPLVAYVFAGKVGRLQAVLTAARVEEKIKEARQNLRKAGKA